MNKKLTGAMLAITVAALFTAGKAMTQAKPEEQKKMVKCGGINSCKGKSECSSKANQCKGHNGCKGKGWIQTSPDDCKAKGGTTIN